MAQDATKQAGTCRSFRTKGKASLHHLRNDLATLGLNFRFFDILVNATYSRRVVILTCSGSRILRFPPDVRWVSSEGGGGEQAGRH